MFYRCQRKHIFLPVRKFPNKVDIKAKEPSELRSQVQFTPSRPDQSRHYTLVSDARKLIK